jgi:Leucine-rich repeat (LRR) protein
MSHDDNDDDVSDLDLFAPIVVQKSSSPAPPPPQATVELTFVDVEDNLRTDVTLVTCKELQLYGMQLVSVGDTVTKLSDVTVVSLMDNAFSAVPEWLLGMTRLEFITMSCNRVTKLPHGIAQLRVLRELHLDWNRLVDLPPELGQLSALEQLALSNNELASAPPELANLTRLRSLSLHSNRLTSSGLPSAIGRLTALTALYVRLSFVAVSNFTVSSRAAQQQSALASSSRNRAHVLAQVVVGEALLESDLA